MVFSGVTFLFYFLPIALALHALATPRTRNAVLVVLSLVFYVWGSGHLVVVPLAVVVVGWLLGFPAQYAALTANRGLARLTVGVSVLANLGLLGWFKYGEWVLRSAADAGLHTGAVPEIVIPIGIAFFSLQSLSHTIDVARGRADHLTNPVDFALFVIFFAPLLAGPIVRFHEVDDQIRRRRFDLADIGEGGLRFAHGFAKKVLVADSVAPVADAVFAADAATLSTAEAWVGVVAFTVQIYFDFSGYADMAIGLGRMFGFRLPENFDRPYSALSVSDFWGRWNISLMRWLRDYVYAPLGGSRTRFAVLAYVNVFVVTVLAGIWYGGRGTLVAWSVYHGVWLMLEERLRVGHLTAPGPLREALRRARTLAVVGIGWVLFRADSLDAAIDLYRTMLSTDLGGLAVVRDAAFTRELLVLALAPLVVLLPRGVTTGPRVAGSASAGMGLARATLMLVVLPVAVLFMVSATGSPFLYLEFR